MKGWSMEELAEAARQAGWRVERTQKNHWKFVPPSGRLFYTGSTPSDFRSIRNFAAQLKRAGLALDGF